MTKLNDRRSSMMSSKGAVVLGMLVLAAFAGCTAATRPVAGDTSSGGDAAVQASPLVTAGDGAQTCAQYGGWYDPVAGACDSAGE
jgi:hypothetical protein